jgi:energy-coupling factor transporter ATP-binding protein EcfA2
MQFIPIRGLTVLDADSGPHRHCSHLDTGALPMSFLVLDGLSKSYGDVHALIDMNLSVAKGEFIGLLGPSGCGKTTTLQALAGFVQPTRGRIVLDGRDITGCRQPARPGHRVPELCAVPAHDGGAERGLRAGDAPGLPTPNARRAWPHAGPGAPAGPGHSATRASCRAASASVWRWRARW